MMKTDTNKDRTDMRESSVTELILKGIDISESPGIAIFGVTDTVHMYYANKAFLNIFGYTKKEYEECAATFLNRLKYEHGRDLVLSAKEGFFRVGETKEVTFAYYTKKSEKINASVEVTFLEKREEELVFYCVMKETEVFPLVSLRDPRIAEKLNPWLQDGQIEVFLQPKFSLMTRKAIGAEGLARWINSDGVVIMPADFIPALEKAGCIIELDFYIYEKVLKAMKHWKKKGLKLLPVSVNFSRAHIRNESFVTRICSLAEQYGVDRDFIEIEITESMLSDDDDKMRQDMVQLQRAGFKVDMDDFGTGYSSLNMLLTAPIDIVKVDKSFLDNITHSKKNRDYVNHLVNLIKVADKEVIFEGVETEHQAQILKNYGYTQAQGFLFGEAIPVPEFAKKYMNQESQWKVCTT